MRTIIGVLQRDVTPPRQGLRPPAAVQHIASERCVPERIRSVLRSSRGEQKEAPPENTMKRTNSSLVSIALLGLASGAANATPIVYDFTGAVTQVSGIYGSIALGTSITG